MTERVTALTDVETHEVSLVFRGANRKRVALAKSENQMDEILEAVLKTAADDEQSVLESLKKFDLDETGIGAARGAIRLLASFKDKLTPEAVAEVVKSAGYAIEAEDAVKEEPITIDKLDPELQAIFKEKQDAVDKLEAEKAELAKSLAKEQDERRQKEFVAKAEKSFGDVAPPEAVGRFLKALHEAGEDIAKLGEEILATAQERVDKTELLKEIGTDTQDEADAWTQMQNAAREIQKSDASMSLDQAITIVMKRRPELYKSYENQKLAKA